jgi:hypothetical protein
MVLDSVVLVSRSAAAFQEQARAKVMGPSLAVRASLAAKVAVPAISVTAGRGSP